MTENPRKLPFLLSVPVVALLSGWTVGCGGGTYRPADRAARTPTTVRVDESSESPSPERRPITTLPAEPTVDDYVRVAMERNPAIVAAELRVKRLEQRIPQATSLDDPMVSVAPVGEMAETAAGQVGTMVGVSQKFPAPGKLRTRGRIAEQAVAVARAEHRRVRLRVAAEVRRAYWSHYAAARAMEVTERSRDVLSDVRRIARANYESGTVGQQDVLRASVALGNLDKELLDLYRRRDSASAMLNRLLDRPTDAQLPDPPVVELKAADAELNSLLAEAAAENPELVGIRERIDQHRFREELASLQRRPDLTVSANYTAVRSSGLSPVADGSDQWWVGFTVNVPLWLDKLDAAEREATLGRREAEMDLADARNRLTFELSDALYRLRSDTRQAKLLAETILPEADQALKAARAGYRAGGEDFLTVLEAWRRRLDLELMYHQALARAEKDRADVEQIVGRDPADDDASTPAGDETDEREAR